MYAESVFPKQRRPFARLPPVVKLPIFGALRLSVGLAPVVKLPIFGALRQDGQNLEVHVSAAAVPPSIF